LGKVETFVRIEVDYDSAGQSGIGLGLERRANGHKS
jgi:hypothetical protein